MAEAKSYLYGPVPSRRLGRSLGIDIIPPKICTLDCVYCQIGKTSQKSIDRKNYVPVEQILTELKEKLAQGLQADFITISGSGEPTLNIKLGQIIEEIKKITNIPVAILTNGTLLSRPDVRADCARADVVLPSLDAGDTETFEQINRPHKDISIEKLIDGLCKFREEFTGQIWLEVFFVEGVNTDTDQIAKIAEAIKRINPDKVQLNTAVRPTIEPSVKKVTAEKLQAIASQMGSNCHVVADFPQKNLDNDIENGTYSISNKTQTLLSMLKRRPCSLNDICASLSIHRNEALKHISYLQQTGAVDCEQRDGITFFKAD